MLVILQNHSFCEVFIISQLTRTKQKTPEPREKTTQKSSFFGTSIKTSFWGRFDVPKPFQNGPKTHPKSKKVDQTSTRKTKLQIKSKKCRKIPSKSPQEAPRGVQEAPRGFKRAPRGPKELPKGYITTHACRVKSIKIGIIPWAAK